MVFTMTKSKIMLDLSPTPTYDTVYANDTANIDLNFTDADVSVGVVITNVQDVCNVA